jgi:hypothetical protein
MRHTEKTDRDFLIFTHGVTLSVACPTVTTDCYGDCPGTNAKAEGGLSNA